MRTELAPDLSFKPVATEYQKVIVLRRLIEFVVTAVILAAVAIVATYLEWRIFAIIVWIALGAMTVINLIRLVVARRQARALGYAELDQELVIRSGIMFRRIAMVPYGRMQQVNVSTGPLLSRYSLANVQLVTASATTNAVIPGLHRAEAERLREKLTELGTESMEGL